MTSRRKKYSAARQTLSLLPEEVDCQVRGRQQRHDRQDVPCVAVAHDKVQDPDVKPVVVRAGLAGLVLALCAILGLNQRESLLPYWDGLICVGPGVSF